MGYDLHITRKKDHVAKEGPAITPEEWLAVVKDDPELMLEETNTRFQRPYCAWWSGPGKYPCWIDYSEYEHGLYSKNPTPEFTDKMVQLAKLMDGKVQGDDGEIYPETGDPYWE